MKKTILTRWSGLSDEYHAYRIRVPTDLIQMLLSFTGLKRAGLVIDLGSGTGLSSISWSGYANRIIGVEPSPEMLQTAKKYNTCKNVHFIQAYAHDTGLKSSSADIICASSAIHWMPPRPTIAEADRLLKSSGIFTFFGPSHPPVTPFLELDRAYIDLEQKVKELQPEYYTTNRWTWEEILATISEMGVFSEKRFFYIHHKIRWNADDYINWLETVIDTSYLIAKEPAFDTYYQRFKEKVFSKFGVEDTKKTCLFVFKVYAFAKE